MSTRLRYLIMIIASIVVMMAVFFAPLASTLSTHAATPSMYTMSSFSNSSEANMYIYQSTDGLNFSMVGSGPAYTPPAGIIRDPSITHNSSNGLYYVAYTDAWASNSIGLASSPDRLHWTFVENIPFASTINIAWAPEWFKDTDGSVNIIVHLRYKGTTNPAPYKITALNTALTSWSAPVALAGLSNDYIDSFVLKLGNVYHIFAKNDQTKYIEHATATKLTGPYTFVGTGDWAGWGPQLEGPCLYQLDNGTWRITLDGYKSGQYYYSDSTNTFKTWTAKKPLPDGLSGFVRHLTILKEPGSGGGFNPSSHYTLVNRNSGEVLDVTGASTANGASVIQWPGRGSTNQQWSIVATGSYYKLVNVKSGKDLDVTNSSTADGTLIDQWTDNGGANQQWSIVAVGSYYKLVNLNSGKVLTVSGASKANGASVVQSTDQSGTNQQWSIVLA